MSAFLLNNKSGSLGLAISMINGHHRFLKKNTGTTYDPKVQHFVQNEEGMLSNNRHFIADTQMEYQPNGDATTEGQSLHIIGYCYAYMATKNKEYLDAAIHHWNAYVDYFYAGQPIPETPRRWIANWLVNGKEPCLSNWPIDTVSPTHGGYKCVPIRFVNGEAQIPHGSPFWGEYLDVITFAHRGHMTWGAINGGVIPIAENIDWDYLYDNHRITTMPSDPTSPTAWVDWQGYLGKPSYALDWSNDEIVTYPVNTMVAWTGNKIGIGPGPDDQLWSGDIIESNLPHADKGKIKLQDITVNGVYFINYAVRLPLEHGGYMFDRNEVWHNRPIHTPLLGSVNQMGNAADGEEWFADACHLLWELTGEVKYKKARDASLFTNYEYTQIDSNDKFFRRSTSATTPFTDGISYSFTYPSTADVVIDRNQDGFISVTAAESAQVSVEQQTIWFRVNSNSKIRTEYGGIGINGASVNAKIQLSLNTDKHSLEETLWGITLPSVAVNNINTVDIGVSNLTRINKPGGGEYIMADSRAATEYGSVTWFTGFETSVLDGRSASVIVANFPNTDGGFIVGNWLQPNGTAPLNKIVYRSNGLTYIRFEDDSAWRWYWDLPNTDGVWVALDLDMNSAVLSGHQPSHPAEEPRPTAPNVVELGQFTVLSDDINPVEFAYYCINDIPERYIAEDGYTLTYRLTLSCDEPYNAIIGDCTVVDPRDDALAYCPGVIPFSNIYTEGSDQIGAWHGMPYPGYQYPVIYVFGGDEYNTHLNNMVDFLYDAQQYYFNQFGVLGPVASAYVWDRWDNYPYGDPDSFTMYHWGDGKAWSGYQSRAFQGACRAWQELVKIGKPVPQKLIDYCENWIKWLASFALNNDMQTPDEFYPDGVIEAGFTGHMVGLYLSGVCLAGIAGCTLREEIDTVAEACLKELRKKYVVTNVPNHNMNGSWSPAVRVSTDNGMFFGFWAGEILRGLGSYIMYKTRSH